MSPPMLLIIIRVEHFPLFIVAVVTAVGLATEIGVGG